MPSFLDQIRQRIADAKGTSLVGGRTMTGKEPNEVVINPEIIMRNEQRLQEATYHERVKNHPAVESVDDGGKGDYFVNLKKGWHYDGQRSFGNDSAKEALKVLKHVEQGTLEESANPDRHVLFWGRVNPPHIGHEAAADKVKEEAANQGASHSFVLTRTHKPGSDSKDPLTPEQKLQHAQRAFPDSNVELADAHHPTLLHHLSKLHENGIRHLTLVAGDDRIPEYKKLIEKYNGVGGKGHGYYNFKSVNFVSSGERDPDSEGKGVSGASASAQRKHAQENNLKAFTTNAPSKMKPHHVKELFNAVRQGLGHKLNESANGCPKCGRLVCRVH